MKMQLCSLPFDSQIQILKTVDDQIITDKIQTALVEHKAMQQAFIHVETFAGGVELTGWVSKAAQKQLALALAADIQGVSYVVNNLSVRG
ncbi:MAG TPA: BON domain-containing protein [Sulfuriferula sp.]|nr:BON domain-containing protein [Sulfuriferula sp.]